MIPIHDALLHENMSVVNHGMPFLLLLDCCIDLFCTAASCFDTVTCLLSRLCIMETYYESGETSCSR